MDTLSPRAEIIFLCSLSSWCSLYLAAANCHKHSSLVCLIQLEASDACWSGPCTNRRLQKNSLGKQIIWSQNHKVLKWRTHWKNQLTHIWLKVWLSHDTVRMKVYCNTFVETPNMARVTSHTITITWEWHILDKSKRKTIRTTFMAVFCLCHLVFHWTVAAAAAAVCVPSVGEDLLFAHVVFWKQWTDYRSGCCCAIYRRVPTLLPVEGFW